MPPPSPSKCADESPDLKYNFWVEDECGGGSQVNARNARAAAHSYAERLADRGELGDGDITTLTVTPRGFGRGVEPTLFRLECRAKVDYSFSELAEDD